MAAKVEDYALIGDCETAALIGRDGAIDWLCWPRFDSGACFAALLGTGDNGRWLLGAADPTARLSRHYRDQTLILETEIETASGAATVIDFMPPRGRSPDLVRLVRGRRGKVAMRTELAVRFDYGSLVPWMTRLDDGGLCLIEGPDLVVLRSPIALRGDHEKATAEFTVAAGETVSFALSYGASHLMPPGPIAPLAVLHETEEYWRQWAGRVRPAKQWTDAVIRSLITLKALIHRPTGGMVAAPTTSLPERLGGKRN